VKIKVYISVIEDGKEAVRSPKKGELFLTYGDDGVQKAAYDFDRAFPIVTHVEVDVPEGIEGLPIILDNPHRPETSNGWWEILYKNSVQEFVTTFGEKAEHKSKLIFAAVNFLSAILQGKEGA
jgi:hypothetical protein